MFKHFIFLRYNLKIYDKPNAEEWMAERLELFKRFTLDGINKQTSKNFTVLMAFDERTPNIKEITDLLKVDFRVIHTDHLTYMRKLRREARYLITTRLDNDDSWHECIIKDIQAEFMLKTEVIDFKGYQLDSNTGILYTNSRKYANSPFITLIEQWADVKTVHYDQHSNMILHFNHKMIDKYRHCMIIHNNNVCNKITGDEINTNGYAALQGWHIRKSN